MLDESGSVTSGADPIRFRHHLLARALESVARSCTCGKCSAAVVTFDRTLLKDPFRLDRAGVRALRSVFDAMPATSSYASSALSWAEDLTARHPARGLVVLCSDFQIFDDPSEQVYMRLADTGDQRLAVVLRSLPPDDLDRLSIPTCEVTDQSSPTQVADAVADAVRSLRAAPQEES